MYFQFPTFIFAAFYKEQCIILNILNNQYISLGKKARNYLKKIITQELQSECVEKESDLNYYIKLFLEKKIIEETHIVKRRNQISVAYEEIGLNKLDWMPTHEKGEINTSFIKLSTAFINLIKIHTIIHRQSMNGLINFLAKKRKPTKIKKETDELRKVKEIAYTLDKACMFYPKKTLCLPWAGTFSYLLLKHNISFKFCIGVQTEPFYAHAWVEYKGKVINDNPEIQKRLAPIFSLSFHSE